LVRRVARQFIELHGTNAVDVLCGHADRAATEGDGASSQTWLDIADAAKRLLLERERHRRDQRLMEVDLAHDSHE
jgi:hypothetical protein